MYGKKRGAVKTLVICVIVLLCGVFAFGLVGAGIDRLLNPPTTKETAMGNMLDMIKDRMPNPDSYKMLTAGAVGNFEPGTRTVTNVIYSYLNDDGRRVFQRMFFLIDDDGDIVDSRLITRAPVGNAKNPWPSPN